MADAPHFPVLRLSDASKDCPSSLELQWLERLDSICESFEADWKKGLNPSPEVYAAQVEPSRFVETHRELVLVQQECIRGLYLPPLEAMELPPGNGSDGSSVPDGNAHAEWTPPSGIPPSGIDGTWRIDGPDRTFKVPKSVGRYLLHEEIGSGTDGVVFRAEDTEIKRTVALKIPRTYFMRMPIDPHAFLREARSAIHHPNIVRVYDRGYSQGIPYLITEYVHGVDMKTYLKRTSKVDYTQVASWVAELAEALDYVHSLGVFHRDVKPSNIMLETNLVAPHLRKEGEPIANPRAKLLDFGIAKLHDAGSMGSHMGDVIGTPHYMSPEQASGNSHMVDGRSDVYSLGVVLYEALCGKTPFAGQNWELLTQIYSRDVPLVTERNPEVPHALARICHRCLQREPDNRYATAGMLALDLRSYLDNRDLPATTTSGYLPRSIPWTWAISGAVLASIVFAPILAGMVWNKVGAKRETIALRPLVDLDFDSRDTFHLPRYAAELKYADPNSLYEHLTESPENQAELKRDFRALLVDRSMSEPESRLRIISSMLLLEPNSWDLLNIREEAISLLVRESMKTKLSSSLIPWLKYYVGLKAPLARSLEDMLPQQHDLATRRAIIQLLGILYEDSPDRLLEKISHAPCFEIDAWLSSYRQVRPNLSSLLASARLPIDHVFPFDQSGEEMTRRQANLLLAQWANGDFDAVWKSMKNSQDPRVRTHFFDLLSPSELPVVQLVDRLETEEDPDVLYSILIALGLQTSEQRVYWENHVVDWVAQAYASHPEPGVHSACQWLLRKWGHSQLIDEIDARLMLEGESPDRHWYVNSLGMHMLRMVGPARFWAGTPNGITNSVVDEVGSEVELKHSFYVSAGEVTWHQWNRLMAPTIPDATQLVNQHKPATHVDFIHCVEFCNLLNVREDRFDFPNRLADSGEVYLLDDKQTGYRLLRDKEWERSARAGTITDCHFGMQGSVADGLPHFNNNEVLGDTCLSIPNSLGLFDCYANAAEWVADKWLFKNGQERDTNVFDFAKSSIVRGRFVNNNKQASLYRKYPFAIFSKHEFIGFRIGRTYLEKETD